MFKIRRLHQIEMTSHCNLRCRYCPSPKLGREKLHMDRETYLTALGWAGHFVAKGLQNELNLAGIGESTMHPDFIEFLALARKVVGDGCALVLATNGLLVTPELAKEMARYKPMVWVSMHRPEKAGPAIEALRAAGILNGVSADPSVASINWAGQVDWHVSAAPRNCDWIAGGRAFVLADGRVSRCCLDATGKGVFAHVRDNLAEMRTSPWELCRTCDQNLNIPGYNQREAA